MDNMIVDFGERTEEGKHTLINQDDMEVVAEFENPLDAMKWIMMSEGKIRLLEREVDYSNDEEFDAFLENMDIGG